MTGSKEMKEAWNLLSSAKGAPNFVFVSKGEESLKNIISQWIKLFLMGGDLFFFLSSFSVRGGALKNIYIFLLFPPRASHTLVDDSDCPWFQCENSLHGWELRNHLLWSVYIRTCINNWSTQDSHHK